MFETWGLDAIQKLAYETGKVTADEAREYTNEIQVRVLNKGISHADSLQFGKTGGESGDEIQVKALEAGASAREAIKFGKTGDKNGDEAQLAIFKTGKATVSQIFDNEWALGGKSGNAYTAQGLYHGNFSEYYYNSVLAALKLDGISFEEALKFRGGYLKAERIDYSGAALYDPQIEALKTGKVTVEEALEFKGEHLFKVKYKWNGYKYKVFLDREKVYDPQLEALKTGKVTVEDALRFKGENIQYEEGSYHKPYSLYDPQIEALKTGKVTVEEALKFSSKSQIEVLNLGFKTSDATLFGKASSESVDEIQIEALKAGVSPADAVLFGKTGSKEKDLAQLSAFKTGKVTVEEALKFSNKYQVQALETTEVQVTVEEALLFTKTQSDYSYGNAVGVQVQALRTGKITTKLALKISNQKQLEALKEIVRETPKSILKKLDNPYQIYALQDHIKNSVVYKIQTLAQLKACTHLTKFSEIVKMQELVSFTQKLGPLLEVYSQERQFDNLNKNLEGLSSNVKDMLKEASNANTQQLEKVASHIDVNMEYHFQKSNVLSLSNWIGSYIYNKPNTNLYNDLKSFNNHLHKSFDSKTFKAVQVDSLVREILDEHGIHGAEQLKGSLKKHTKVADAYKIKALHHVYKIIESYKEAVALKVENTIQLEAFEFMLSQYSYEDLGSALLIEDECQLHTLKSGDDIDVAIENTCSVLEQSHLDEYDL